MKSSKVVTGKVRFSYANLFEARSINDGEDPKYSVTLLIPKADKDTIAKFKDAMEGAKEYYLSKKGNKLPGVLKNTIHDGDGERPNGGEFGPECAGCYVITVSSKDKPVIVDNTGNRITDSTEVYSGCYGRASINFYVYDKKGNRGISAGLLGVQKLHDGEALSGSRGSADDFNDGYTDGDYDDLLG